MGYTSRITMVVTTVIQKPFEVRVDLMKFMEFVCATPRHHLDSNPGTPADWTAFGANGTQPRRSAPRFVRHT
jgi:hypothetical protein